MFSLCYVIGSYAYVLMQLLVSWTFICATIYVSCVLFMSTSICMSHILNTNMKQVIGNYAYQGVHLHFL